MKALSAISVIALLAASGCDIAENVAGQTVREGAKAVVGPIVAETIPGQPGVILTDCIIDNASLEELGMIAAGGINDDNVALVSQILARPETIACATAGLTA